jgi:hypothetical protein
MDSNTTNPIHPDAGATPFPNPGTQGPAAASPASPNTEANALEKVLPQIHELAQKVGGMKKLADIIRQLDQGGE